MNAWLLKFLMYGATIVWIAALTLMGVGVPDGIWKPFGVVSLFVSGVLFIYERWAWSWVPVRISSTPDLRGTWRATLDSTWVDPKTSQKIAPIEAYFTIVQTATSLTLCMLTKESRSWTLVAKLEQVDGTNQVVGVYRSDPGALVRGRSPIHYGGLRLHVGGPPTSLHGEYWTERGTKGEITLEFSKRTLAHDFATAQALCSV